MLIDQDFYYSKLWLRWGIDVIYNLKHLLVCLRIIQRCFREVIKSFIHDHRSRLILPKSIIARFISLGLDHCGSQVLVIPTIDFNPRWKLWRLPSFLNDFLVLCVYKLNIYGVDGSIIGSIRHLISLPYQSVRSINTWSHNLHVSTQILQGLVFFNGRGFLVPQVIEELLTVSIFPYVRIIVIHAGASDSILNRSDFNRCLNLTLVLTFWKHRYQRRIVQLQSRIKSWTSAIVSRLKRWFTRSARIEVHKTGVLLNYGEVNWLLFLDFFLLIY